MAISYLDEAPGKITYLDEEPAPVAPPPVADWRAAAAAQMRPLGAQVGLPERPSHEEPLETPEEQAKRAALVEETRRAKGSRRLQELDLAAAKGLETGAQILSGIFPTTAISRAAQAVGLRPIVPPEHVKQIREGITSAIEEIVPRAQVPEDAPRIIKPELGKKINEALTEFGDETLSSFTSLDQAALLASGAPAPKVVGRLFELGSILSIPEATEQLKEAVKSGDAKQITKAGAGLGMSLAIPAAIERGLAPKPAPIVPPVTGRVLELPARVEPPPRPPEAAPVAPAAPVRPPTATETTPVVPPAEMPTTPTATGVRPAIRLVGGKVVVGDAGKTHPQILKENKIKRDEIDQRGFVNEQGQFMDREQTAAATGVTTVAEPARQHSTDLPEATVAPPPGVTVPPVPPGRLFPMERTRTLRGERAQIVRLLEKLEDIDEEGKPVPKEGLSEGQEARIKPLRDRLAEIEQQLMGKRRGEPPTAPTVPRPAERPLDRTDLTPNRRWFDEFGAYEKHLDQLRDELSPWIIKEGEERARLPKSKQARVARQQRINAITDKISELRGRMAKVQQAYDQLKLERQVEGYDYDTYIRQGKELPPERADIYKGVIPTPEAPKPPPTEPTPAKEPWQMTKEEFAQSDYYKALRRKMRRIKESAPSVQLRLINQAIERGESIPPEVLADYPDLKPPPAAPAAAKVESAKPPYEINYESPSGGRATVTVSRVKFQNLPNEMKRLVERLEREATTLGDSKEFDKWNKVRNGKTPITLWRKQEGAETSHNISLETPETEFANWATRSDLYNTKLNPAGQALRDKLIGEREAADKAQADKEAAERAETERRIREFREYESVIAQQPLPTGKKSTLEVTNKEGVKSTLQGTRYGEWFIHKVGGGKGRYAQPTVYKVSHVRSGLGVSAEGLPTLEQAKNYVRALIHAKVRTDWKLPSDLSKAEHDAILEVGKAWVAGGDVPSYFKPPKLEARAEGFTGKPLEENEVWLSLQLHQGIGKGGKVSVVFRPEESHLGQIFFDRETGKVTGIEINRANISTHAQLDWVMEHEVGHGFDLENPQATARLRGTLTPEEWTTIQGRIESLGYSPEVHAAERTAMAVQRLAESWRGRNWFERLVGNVMRYASDLGIRMTRLGAESAAVRGLAQSLERIREGAPREGEGAALQAREKPPIAKMGGGERLNKLGDPYGTTYHATPADWTEWQRLLSRPMMEEGIWPAREAMKNKYGGMPPQPPLAEGVLQARGPGAQTIGEPATKAQIEQLEESFRNIRGQRVPFTDKIKEAFNLGERAAGAVNAVGKAVAGLKASGDYLISLWKGVPKIDELLRAKGELSKEMNVRGWHIRQTIRTMAKGVPRAADQAAIAKWIDAGGDRAALQRGLAEAPDKYKQAYQDALNLKGDLLVSAQNAQNYFEARLQEAIDAGVLKEGVEDYLHRIYERTPERAERAIAYVQSALLKPNPSLARKRVFQWDWEAEKLGWKPVQSFIPRIAHYEASLSKAIASRAFIRRATEMKASDGRPVIDIKGVGIPIEDQAGVREGTLIKPSFNPQRNTQATLPNGTPNPNYRGDYVNREYPSLSRWKWAASDAAGKPIFVQGDVAIHPEFVARVDSLLRPSLLRVGKQAKIFRPLMGVSSTFKQTMLDLSGFHQVQITVHGLEHRVWALPTGVAPPGFAKIVREIDFADPNVDALLRSGVTLGGEHYMPYREGLIGSALTRHVPILGPWTETYHNWLFQDYIPRIKMTMALHALERNRARYAGKMTDEQILFKTANEANAAFGELNYTMLERSQTARDISRLIMLAPDFLEARARFAGAAFQRGGKMFGNEQRTALLFGALTMWLTARVLNKLISGQYHDEPENAFSIVVNGKSYGLRTVQGDIMHAATKPVEFIMHRLNPVYTRIFVELASGRDEFGRKRTPLEAVWDTVSNIRPIALRSSEERNLWESMANAFGITARRYNEVDRAFKLAQAWKSEHGVQERGEFIYDPEKDPLRSLKLALVRNDDAGATEQIRKLLESKTIDRVKLNQYFNRYATMPFTGSKENDKKFIATLSEDSRQTVEAAREHKKQINQLYLKALSKYDAEKTLFAPPARVPAGKVTYLDPLGIESGGP